jgi:ankyrin repeat protein
MPAPRSTTRTNLKDDDGDTAFVIAGQEGRNDMEDLLVEHGAMKSDIRINKSPYPFKPLPPAKRWALAATAMLTQANRGSHPAQLQVVGRDGGRLPRGPANLEWRPRPEI